MQRIFSEAAPGRIYLASQSPRRRELLRQIGVAHDVLLLRNSGRGSDVDETPKPGELALAYVERVCRAKVDFAACAVISRHLPLQPVLTADTAVVLGNDILGKPENAAGAAAMLSRLSGSSHQVLTAVAVRLGDRVEAMVSVSTVVFRAISEDEIRRYVQSGEPMDKAGAYAIQGRAGAFVASLNGSYSGVMGLPLFETAELLTRFGYRI
jgi:septum formation protein